jgi:glycosyltransferase involved in cell wall biosynthesis
LKIDNVAGWHLIFWEPTLSPHKLALVRALARHPAVASCRYVSDSGLSADRTAQGWQLGNLDDLEVLLAPSHDELRALVGERGETTVHVFSGLRGKRVIVEGLRCAVRHRARFLLLSEPRASEGWQGLARRAQSLATEGALRRYAAGVLAIGRNGPAWFRAAGYARDRIFPFAYFLPDPPAAPRIEARSDLVRIGYLGRLVEAKGIGVVLDSLPLLPPAVRIEIAGHGAEASRVDAAVKAFPGRVAYHGPIPMHSVPAFLDGIDILVQPSRTTDDGWAAVVSEALFAGAMVVASANVGASILLDSPERGQVLLQPDARLLAEAVTRIVSSPHLAPAERLSRRAWAHERLTGEAGAAYLVAILAHLFDGASRPPPYYA